MVTDLDFLRLWTVYDHPTDRPDVFLAKEYIIGIGPLFPKASGLEITSTDIDVIRKALMVGMGLTVIPRSPGDDPVIIETWV